MESNFYSHKSPTLIIILAALTICVSHPAASAAGPGRIAISADGDKADPDDWGAMPMELALIAKTNLRSRLVHVDYNNKYPCPTPNQSKQPGKPDYGVRMEIATLGAAEAFGFSRDIFFNNRKDADAAIYHLADEMKKSAGGDPLYIVVNGAYNVVYQAISTLDDTERSIAENHVILIQHSENNMKSVSCNNGWNWENVRDILPGIENRKIAGQGPTLNNKDQTPDQAGFRWLKDSPSPAYNYVYSQINEVYEETRADPDRIGYEGKSDISDSGMMLYLVELLTTGKDRRNTGFTEADFQNVLSNSLEVSTSTLGDGRKQ